MAELGGGKEEDNQIDSQVTKTNIEVLWLIIKPVKKIFKKRQEMTRLEIIKKK